ASGVIVGALALVVFPWLAETLPRPSGRAGTLAWLLLPPAVMLFALAAAIGNARFFTAAIDPLAGRDGRFVAVSRRVLSNTLEQSAVLVLAGWLWIEAVPGQAARWLPAIAVLFTAGRLLFYAGYLRRSLWRAPGMALTFEINAAVLVLAMLALFGPG
ncbi:MAG TPA: MAPEG family protein, partial [Kiloniellales bacterium]|nr:MAPEG family protein [Kiloniellales bacterium]